MIDSKKDKNDDNTNIAFFKESVKEFIESRKWTKYHTPQNLIQAMNIELSELSELFLFRDLEKKDIFQDKTLFKNIKDEVADVFIYLISFINALNIDLTVAFHEKMNSNRERYSNKEFYDGKYYKKKK